MTEFVSTVDTDQLYSDNINRDQEFEDDLEKSQGRVKRRRRRLFAVMATCSAVVVITNCVGIALLVLFFWTTATHGYRLGSWVPDSVQLENLNEQNEANSVSPFGSTIRLTKEPTVSVHTTTDRTHSSSSQVPELSGSSQFSPVDFSSTQASQGESTAPFLSTENTNGQSASNASPFGSTIDLTQRPKTTANTQTTSIAGLGTSGHTTPKESILPETSASSNVVTTQTSTQTPPPSPAQPDFQCPTEMFRCTILIKHNSLFPQPVLGVDQVHLVQHQLILPNQKPLSHVRYMCIDNGRVCNGIRDCPLGEDEAPERCPPKLPPPPPKNEESGCYLCKGTQDKCISMTLLCNGRSDCPREDDEHVSLCSHPDGHHHRPQSVASGTSSFSTNQFAPTNISIVNTVRDREFSEDSYRGHGAAPPGIGEDRMHKRDADSSEQEPTQSWPPSPIDPESPSKGGGVHNGVGFMFRVDNLVIYNSQVKMFNQNSENIAPPSDEAAKNATGQQRPSQQYQQHGNEGRTRLTDLFRAERDGLNVTG